MRMREEREEVKREGSKEEPVRVGFFGEEFELRSFARKVRGLKMANFRVGASEWKVRGRA
jgi:hypothetical protein